MVTRDRSYALTKPCNNCPFRTDVKPYIRPERVETIRDNCVRAEFPCHKTTCADDDEFNNSTSSNTSHCAGALILMEKINQPSQMMRISERLGIYDRTQLDMTAPIYDNWEKMIEAHQK